MCVSAGIRQLALWSGCLAAVIILVGCGSKKSGSPDGEERKLKTFRSAGEDVAPSQFRHIFFGTAGGKDWIQMDLIREHGKIKGLYSYATLRTKGNVKFRRLDGSVGASGTVSATISDWDDRPKGVFEGRVFSQLANNRKILKIVGEQTFADKNSPVALEAANMYDFGDDYTIVTKTIYKSSKLHNYTVDVIYPQIEGGKEHTVKGFNGNIEAFVTERVRAFGEIYDDFPAEDGPAEMSSLDIDFEVVRISPKLISLLFNVSEYNSGAAHPIGGVRTVNYDMRGSKILVLGDMFQNGTDYLAAISEYCRKELSGRDVGDEDWHNEGAGPEEENFKNWVVGQGGIEIHFNPYQVASYAEGEQQVLVPVRVLDGLLRPEARELVLAPR